MNRKKKNALRIGIGIAIILFIFTFGYVAYRIASNIVKRNKEASFDTYELTDREKEYLKERYPEDEDNIEAGMLHPSQYNHLEWVRFINDYLEEKYPGCEFVFVRHIYNGDLFGGLGKRYKSSYQENSYYFLEETSGNEFELSQRTYEDGTIELKDNFYAYYIEEDYAAYYKEQLEQRIDGVVEVKISISREMGEECGSNITVEDVTSGKFDVRPSITIILATDGKTEEECKTYAEMVEKALKEINWERISEVYRYYFYDGTEEEIMNRKKGELKPVYYNNFLARDWESEEEG